MEQANLATFAEVDNLDKCVEDYSLNFDTKPPIAEHDQLIFYECPQCQHGMLEKVYFNVRFQKCPYCDTDLGLYAKKEV